MKCEDYIFCIRSAQINARSGAIHTEHFCLKKGRYIPLVWYDCIVDCKHHKERPNEK